MGNKWGEPHAAGYTGGEFPSCVCCSAVESRQRPVVSLTLGDDAGNPGSNGD